MDGSATEASREKVHGNRRITRAEMLDVAVEMFSWRGYRTTNLGDVAAELGVTRQALYYYVRKKDDILVELFTFVFDELEASIDALDSRDITPGERFHAMLRAHLEAVARHPAHVNLVLTEQEVLPASIREEMLDRRRRYQSRFVSAHRAAVDDGAVADFPSDYVASLLLSAANMTSRWLIRTSNVDVPQFVSMTQTLLAQGYAPQASGRNTARRGSSGR